jgi:hypothetical protein
MKEERIPRQPETWSRRPTRARPSRNRPLTDAARMLRSSARDGRLGPYETRYEIQDGYGLDRAIVEP